MSILYKHKKNGVGGFKRFVYNLEVTQGDTFNTIIQNALLEDPVYMKWIFSNIITHEYIFNYSKNHILEITDKIPNAIKILLLSFHGTPREDEFIQEKLIDQLKKDYLENAALTTEIEPFEQTLAKTTIIKTLRGLQEANRIPPFPWKMPPGNILDGSAHKILTNGPFQLDFEKGIPALRGQTKRKLRTGTWKHYYPNGDLMAEGSYQLGEKVGMWKFMYTNGKIKSQGEYAENLKQGQWVEYNKTGQSSTVHYNRGKKT